MWVINLSVYLGYLSLQMTAHEQRPSNWLERYANQYHEWKNLSKDGKQIYYRPLGIFESSFDTDGTNFEGRADVNALLTLEVQSRLSKAQFRKRVQLAWASLRIQHTLLLAKALDGSGFLPPANTRAADRYFVIEQPETTERVLKDAFDTMIFVEDCYPDVQTEEFYKHCMNTARIFDASHQLAKLFILPLKSLPGGNYRFEAVLVAAHQITDGLSAHMWMAHLIDLLNEDEESLLHGLARFCSAESLWKRLPPAQEDLYPKLVGSPALQRWRWAISRILRQVRRPPPASFSNPLARREKLLKARPMPRNYPKVLDYTKTPPLNSFTLHADLSKASSLRMTRLCREAGVSIGAGCFALVGLTMMELEEEAHPHIAPCDRLPFVGSFPLNPRPFFNYSGPADSLMLAFSDGLSLPFLPCHLPVEGRFRLLARHAHRQLHIYQKRPRTSQATLLGSRSPSELIPASYIGAVERADSRLPPARRKGFNPQGAYPARENLSGATCGVSSIGSSTGVFGKDKYPFDVPEKEFAANIMDLEMYVRARDGEFLVGAAGRPDGLHFGVSYDGNALDEGLVERWRERIEGIFEETGAKL